MIFPPWLWHILQCGFFHLLLLFFSPPTCTLVVFLLLLLFLSVPNWHLWIWWSTDQVYEKDWPLSYQEDNVSTQITASAFSHHFNVAHSFELASCSSTPRASLWGIFIMSQFSVIILASWHHSAHASLQAISNPITVAVTQFVAFLAHLREHLRDALLSIRNVWIYLEFPAVFSWNPVRKCFKGKESRGKFNVFTLIIKNAMIDGKLPKEFHSFQVEV